MENFENKFKLFCLEKATLNYADPNSACNKLLTKAWKLRYSVFREELRWVEENKERLERDEFDTEAVHFIIATEHDSEVVAYSRLIPPGNNLMFDGPFRSLISQREVEELHSLGEQVAEISRLTIRKEFRGGKRGLTLNMLIFRGMYQWSTMKHSIRYWYMVVTPALYRFLKRFFPCTIIGTPKKLNGDQAVSLAVKMDLEECKKILSQKRPTLLKWFLEETDFIRAH